jgi:hypothetical protein
MRAAFSARTIILLLGTFRCLSLSLKFFQIAALLRRRMNASRQIEPIDPAIRQIADACPTIRASVKFSWGVGSETR